MILSWFRDKNLKTTLKVTCTVIHTFRNFLVCACFVVIRLIIKIFWIFLRDKTFMVTRGNSCVAFWIVKVSYFLNGKHEFLFFKIKPQPLRSDLCAFYFNKKARFCSLVSIEKFAVFFAMIHLCCYATDGSRIVNFNVYVFDMIICFISLMFFDFLFKCPLSFLSLFKI